MSEPLVTVVISPREGHFMTEELLLSVLADDTVPFELIYIDIGSPPAVRRALEARAATGGFRLVRHDEWLAPASARKAVLAQVKTRYVAFADNDILVERGCLGKLLACAEETGAGLVCPVYLQGGGGQTPTIHMAGGMFLWSDDPQPRLLAEGHRFSWNPPERAVGLGREEVGFTEYHYLLGRMDLLGRQDAISDEVLLVHEHLDLALFAREQGMTVVLEPAARITYVAFEPRVLMDVDFYRRRWAVQPCADSLAAFARRWPIADRRLVEPMADYAAGRLREVELRRAGAAASDGGEVMRPDELAQSRFQLREQAIARGYGEEAAQSLEAACDLATLVFDGVYRPDGRPFLNHVIGTASVLIRYDLELRIVQAGLLHAVFSHRPAWLSETDLQATLRERFTAEVFIVAQPYARAFLAQDRADLASLNMIGAGALALLAANDVDMRLSGEYRATGRSADLTPIMLERIGEALGHFGLAGLARSAAIPSGEAAARPLLGLGVQQVSFRLDAPNQRLLPVD